ncbi:MAG: hypothetical protein IJC93_03750 [Clostridia bacterium]|nr:hypothetical protein [Clostridia bacterium]
MKIWKRIVLAVLAIAILILSSFAACQVSKAPAETDDSTKPSKTTKQTTKATTTETTTKEATTTTLAADTAATESAATEPVATEPVEQPKPEDGNTNTNGAALGEILRSRFESIPEISLEEFYQTPQGNPLVGTTTELLLEGGLYIDGIEGLLAEMLSNFSSYITYEAQADTTYFSLEQEFAEVENSKFTVELLEMYDELYLSLPDNFGSIISLPLDELLPPEYTDFNGNAQLADDVMANYAQNTSELANALIAVMGDSLSAMLAAIPDDCFRQYETTVEYNQTVVDATGISIVIVPEEVPFILAALLEAIPQSPAFPALCEALMAVTEFSESAEIELPYDSPEEFARDLTDQIADIVEELREFDEEYETGAPTLWGDLIYDDARLYEMDLKFHPVSGPMVKLTYQNTLTETDGFYEIYFYISDNSGDEFYIVIESDYTDSGSLYTGIDLNIWTYSTEESINLTIDTYTYTDEDGCPCFDLYGELLIGEDSGFMIDCYTWSEIDGEDTYRYVQIPDLMVVADGVTMLDGELNLVMTTYENEEVYTYNVDNVVSLIDLTNSEELTQALIEGLCKNPVLAMFAEMLG